MTARNRLTQEQASAIYDVLIMTAGASPQWRDDFIQHAMAGTPEYRFQGNLGFGGKLRNKAGQPPYVDYYPEDRTAERDDIAQFTNLTLARIFKRMAA